MLFCCTSAKKLQEWMHLDQTRITDCDFHQQLLKAALVCNTIPNSDAFWDRSELDWLLSLLHGLQRSQYTDRTSTSHSAHTTSTRSFITTLVFSNKPCRMKLVEDKALRAVCFPSFSSNMARPGLVIQFVFFFFSFGFRFFFWLF